MANPIFNATFSVTGGSPAGTGPYDWYLQGTVYDAVGNFSALNAQIGDIIVLDTGNSVPGSVSRYVIKAFNNPSTYTNLDLIVTYLDNDLANIDPTTSVGVIGIIGHPSSNEGFVWLAAYDVQGFGANIVTFANDIQFQEQLDNVSAFNVTDSFTLASGDITNGYVELSALPNINSVEAFVTGGPPLAGNGIDFAIVSDGTNLQRFSWSTLGLDGIVSAGDVLTVKYNKYNLQS